MTSRSLPLSKSAYTTRPNPRAVLTTLHAMFGQTTLSPADTVLDALISSQVVDWSSPTGGDKRAGKIGLMSAAEPVVDAVDGRDALFPPGTKDVA